MVFYKYSDLELTISQSFFRFSFKTIYKNLDPSYKVDLDL